MVFGEMGPEGMQTKDIEVNRKGLWIWKAEEEMSRGFNKMVNE
jgi:hypothetical protein